MKIRIHHFFDIIRDFGSGKKIVPHPSLHSYHKIAEQIRKDPDIELKLVVKSDAVCKGCIHLKNSECNDIITHRTDFTGKEDFNNHLDKRIVDACNFDLSTKYFPRSLCELANNYLEKIHSIYEGNDWEHTQLRKENVIKGLKYYSENHGFSLDYIS